MPQLPDHIILDNPNVLSMDQAMDAAFDALEIEKLGGASGRGWSNYNMLQRCPRMFQLNHIRKVEVSRESKALSVGIAFHAFMALYYVNLRALQRNEEEGPSPSRLRDELFEQNADPEYVAEAWRIFAAYADYYEAVGDYLEPIAIEKLARDPKTGNTCRYDLIARVNDSAKDRGIIPGIYVVEHKSASRLDRAATEGWYLDGEVLGQLLIYPRAGLSRLYGKIQGVIVNIAVKTKTPTFHREIVAPPARQVAQQGRDLQVWESLERMYRSTNTWPRALAACYGHRYGPCHYVDVCKD